MATYKYESLKKKYDNFTYPVAIVRVGGVKIGEKNKNLVVSDIDIELTAGFEASVASFAIYNVFDDKSCKFLFDSVKKFVLLGSSVSISLGYGSHAKQVFVGFISRVNFSYQKGSIPCVQVTAMDVKGIMMSSCYFRQLKATNYSDAVEEIFKKTAYNTMKSGESLIDFKVTATNDKRGGTGGASNEKKTSAYTVEMVGESDYDFVVRAAKRFNYEFFTEAGLVLFRKAKSVNDILMDLGPSGGLRTFDVEYDVTGLVENVIARSTDVGKAKMIESKKKFSNKISTGNKAAKLLKGSQKVILDPTINAKEDADIRVASVMEEMSYRFGSLQCESLGFPELFPGHFINISEIGSPAENKFYIMTVRQRMTTEDGFITNITAKAASIDSGSKLGF